MGALTLCQYSFQPVAAVVLTDGANLNRIERGGKLEMSCQILHTSVVALVPCIPRRSAASMLIFNRVNTRASTDRACGCTHQGHAGTGYLSG